jgi:hypothetical protein
MGTAEIVLLAVVLLPALIIIMDDGNLERKKKG